jgi:hypothetical protein
MPKQMQIAKLWPVGCRSKQDDFAKTHFDSVFGTSTYQHQTTCDSDPATKP